MNERVRRIRTEAAVAAAAYTDARKVDMDPAGSWVVLRGFRLPPGYNRSTCSILLRLPPSYPRAAPDFFWADMGLRTWDGRIPQHYLEHWQRFAADAKNGWATCSLHIKSWRAHFDPAKGHNLSTVCQLIEQAFRRWAV
jgi:hypothetical protein